MREDRVRSFLCGRTEVLSTSYGIVSITALFLTGEVVSQNKEGKGAKIAHSVNNSYNPSSLICQSYLCHFRLGRDQIQESAISN